jgi:hypothetical protein
MIGNKKLATLDLSKNTALQSLYCQGNNNLAVLDVSECTALTNLDCSNETWRWDEATQSEIYVSGKLSTLDLSKCTALTELNCRGNLLTSLDLSKNTALNQLNCSDNLLTSLDLYNNIRLSAVACSLNCIIPSELKLPAFVNVEISYQPQRSDCSTIPISSVKKSDKKHGVLLKNSIVSDKAEMLLVLPNKESVISAKIVIYDNVGNVVFETTSKDGKATWNLTNAAGRSVANGTYLVVAEVKGISGNVYAYSAKVGVRR